MKRTLKILGGILCGIVLIYLIWLPYVPQLKKENPASTTLIERRKNQALKKGRELKPKIYWKRMDEISPHLVHAVLLAEDDIFYQHSGFDFDQIKIALKINWQKKGSLTEEAQLLSSLPGLSISLPQKTFYEN